MFLTPQEINDLCNKYAPMYIKTLNEELKKGPPLLHEVLNLGKNEVLNLNK